MFYKFLQFGSITLDNCLLALLMSKYTLNNYNDLNLET